MSLPELVHGSWLMACLPARQVNRKYKTTNNEPPNTNRKSEGFTLIELLVVISIIAILMAVATVSYVNAQQKGRDNKRKSDLKAVQQALEIYFNQNGKYPQSDPTSGVGSVECSGAASGINWGSAFTCNSITYMNPLPKDPINATPYFYYYNSSAPYSTYVLSAKLENTKDPDLPQMSGCQPSPYNWCVKNP